MTEKVLKFYYRNSLFCEHNGDVIPVSIQSVILDFIGMKVSYNLHSYDLNESWVADETVFMANSLENFKDGIQAYQEEITFYKAFERAYWKPEIFDDGNIMAFVFNNNKAEKVSISTDMIFKYNYFTYDCIERRCGYPAFYQNPTQVWYHNGYTEYFDDGSMKFHGCYKERVKLTKKQRKLIDKFTKVYKELMENEIGILLDTESCAVYAYNSEFVSEEGQLDDFDDAEKAIDITDDLTRLNVGMYDYNFDGRGVYVSFKE